MVELLPAEEVKKIFEREDNYRRSFIIIPTDKYLEKCFSLFKRFLKENGNYVFIMSHVFPHKRKKENLFEEVKKLYRYKYDEYNFKDILHMRSTLGDYCRDSKSILNSNEYWESHIKPISKIWEQYFSENFPEIEDGDFIMDS